MNPTSVVRLWVIFKYFYAFYFSSRKIFINKNIKSWGKKWLSLNIPSKYVNALQGSPAVLEIADIILSQFCAITVKISPQ